MSAAAKGYPGTRRAVRNVVDRRTTSRFPANDPRKLRNVGAKPLEVFRYSKPVQGEFGRKVAQAGAGTAGARLGGRFALRAFPYVGAALTAYEIYQYLAPGEPIPRDPANSEDMELSIPTGWTKTVTEWGPTSYTGPAYHVSGSEKWYRFDSSVTNLPVASSDGSFQNTPTFYQYVAANRPLVAVASPQTLVDTSLASAERVQRYTRYDASHKPAGHKGTEILEIYRSNGQPGTFEWANPQRVGDPVPVTVIVPSPVQSPAPGRFRRSRDRDENVERAEPRAEPSAPAVPTVPPTFIVEGPTMGRRPGGQRWSKPNPKGRNAPRPRPGDNKPREKPKPGESEKKASMKTVGGQVFALIGRGAGTLTEFFDTVNVLYNALPDSCKPGYVKLHYKDKVTGERKEFYKRRWKPNMQQRIAAVMKCFDHIDMAEALMGLAANDAEDRNYGKLGDMSKKAGDAVKKSTGGKLGRNWQLGNWDSANSKEAWDKKERNRIRDERKKRDEDLRKKAIYRAKKAARNAKRKKRAHSWG